MRAREIVRTLAGYPPPIDIERHVCMLCGVDFHGVWAADIVGGRRLMNSVDAHEESCLWRLAREWVRRHEVQEPEATQPDGVTPQLVTYEWRRPDGAILMRQTLPSNLRPVIWPFDQPGQPLRGPVQFWRLAAEREAELLAETADGVGGLALHADGREFPLRYPLNP